MTSAAEAAGAKVELGADLAAGLNTLTLDAVVTFTQYTLTILPLDGWRYWVATSNTFQAKGALHYSIDKRQNEDELISVNTVIFTSLVEVNDLDDVSPTTLWIAYLGDENIPYAFGTRHAFFKQADLYHYQGDALYPALGNLVANSSDLDPTQAIVSNSLPAWLYLNVYVPPYPTFVTGITLYPSFAVPENLQPPYGTVHIDPAGEEGLQGAPWFDSISSQRQLTRERIRVTLYGFNNLQAQTFLSAVEQYSYDWGIIGFTSHVPIIRDEKRTQRELGILAQKKSIEFEINYTQGAIRNIARQLIETAITSIPPQPFPEEFFLFSPFYEPLAAPPPIIR